MFYDSQLHALLVRKLPEHVRGGRIHPATLAAAMKYSTFRVYTMLTDDKLSPKAARTLLKLSAAVPREEGMMLSQEDLLPFLLG
jgi:hypothetical protein